MHLAQFVLYFLVAPTALLLAAYGSRGVRHVLAAGGVLAVAAGVALLMLDALLVHLDVWLRDAEEVITDVGGVPIEDVVLFALQAVFVTTLVAILMRRSGWRI